MEQGVMLVVRLRRLVMAQAEQKYDARFKVVFDAIRRPGERRVQHRQVQVLDESLLSKDSP